jgi:hypothetical protein
MPAVNSFVDAVFDKAEALRAKAAELGLGTGGEPVLLRKWVGRVAAIVAGWAATNIPGVAGFEDVLAALLGAAAVETVTDLVARTGVAPKWKVVTAAIAAQAGRLDSALSRANATVDSFQETVNTRREQFRNR